MKSLLTTITVAITIMMSACTLTVKSHEPTEKKIQGTWEATTTETEDGVKITTTMRETYSLPDHQFEATVTMHAGSPVNRRIVTITYSGQWRASKEMIVNHIDKNSIDFNYNTTLLDRSDIIIMKREMTAELKKHGYREALEFKSDITDRFTAEDDEGELYTYIRLN